MTSTTSWGTATGRTSKKTTLPTFSREPNTSSSDLGGQSVASAQALQARPGQVGHAQGVVPGKADLHRVGPPRPRHEAPHGRKLPRTAPQRVGQRSEPFGGLAQPLVGTRAFLPSLCGLADDPLEPQPLAAPVHLPCPFGPLVEELVEVKPQVGLARRGLQSRQQCHGLLVQRCPWLLVPLRLVTAVLHGLASSLGAEAASASSRALTSRLCHSSHSRASCWART